MDGRRKGEELEVHVRQSSIAVVIALATMVSRADAQRYRVLVATETGQRSVIQFSPCIPAEGSACGAWIDREATADTGIRIASTIAAQFGPGDSLWLDHGAIRIRNANGRSKTIQDQRGAATALALAPTRDYAFVILRKPDAPASTVVMVDLSTRSVIASCPMADRAYALAVIR